MDDENIVQALVILMPLLFIAMWLLTGFLMPRLMGWSRLEEQYPDRPEEVQIARYRFQAAYLAKPGSTGPGLSYRGCVTLDACESGLRISIWKLFQPFSKPIFIPWNDITAVTVKVTGFKMCGLRVGNSNPFTISIIARIARQIDKATHGRLSLPDELS